MGTSGTSCGRGLRTPLERLSKQRAFRSFHPDSGASLPAWGVELHAFPRSSGRRAVFLAFAPVEPHPTAALPTAAPGSATGHEGSVGLSTPRPCVPTGLRRVPELSPGLACPPAPLTSARRSLPGARAAAAGAEGARPGGAGPAAPAPSAPLQSALRSALPVPALEGAGLGFFSFVAQPRTSSRCHSHPCPTCFPPAARREAAAGPDPGPGLTAEQGAEPGPGAWEREGISGGLAGPRMEGMEEPEARPASGGLQ